MPLNILLPQKPTIVSKVKDVIFKTFAYFFHPELFLLVFLLFSIIFEIVGRKVNWGWYVVFGIIVIGYFIERITRIIKKKYGEQKQS